MKDCCEVEISAKEIKTRRALYWSAALNFGMFLVELVYGFLAKSISLKADSVDFLGDSLNYGVSIWAQNKAPRIRSQVAYFKGSVMFLFGLWLIGECVWKLNYPSLPESFTMTILGIAALMINILVAVILFKFRDQDANMQSVWLCTRNDVVGNVLVLLAAFGVHQTQSQWPDLIASAIIASLAVSSGWKVIAMSKKELSSQA